jgi:hypothetical protein
MSEGEASVDRSKRSGCQLGRGAGARLSGSVRELLTKEEVDATRGLLGSARPAFCAVGVAAGVRPTTFRLIQSAGMLPFGESRSRAQGVPPYLLGLVGKLTDFSETPCHAPVGLSERLGGAA